MKNSSRAYFVQIVGMPEGKRETITRYQTANDIVNLCMRAVRDSMPYAGIIAKHFRKGNDVKKTCETVWNWIKLNIIYIKEDNNAQSGKTVKRILNDGFGDCKHYSILAAAIFKAMGFNTYFRVVDQTGTFNHIYVIVKHKGETIIVDPCHSYFNAASGYYRKKDIQL